MRRMILGVVITIAIFAAHSEGAKAGFTSGNRLYEQCESFEKSDRNYEEQADAMMCVGYIMGIADAMIEEAEIGTAASGKYKACLSAGIQFNQLFEIVMMKLRGVPQFRQLSASILVGAAFSRAFPCR